MASHEEEATIWEHLEELSVRLRRIIIAIAIAAVISAAVPLEALQGILALAPAIINVLPFHHTVPNHTYVTMTNNTTNVTMIMHNVLECNVVKLSDTKNGLLVLLRCKPSANNTINTKANSGGNSLLPLPFTISWTPLVVKVPEAIVSVVVPQEVYVAGKTYRVVLMPTGAFEAFEIILFSALLLGVVLASPIIVREIWAYVEPALYPHEKELIKKYGFFFTLLFLFGIALAIFVIAPLTYRVTLSLYPFFIPSDYNVIIKVSVAEVLKFTVELAIATGLIFETPLVIYILIVHGILEPDTVERNLKYVFLGAMILGAIISPDPSGLGMVIIDLTIYLPIHLAVKMAKKKKHAEKD
ncbi:Sec-independent periplasmic protein translocase [Pyrolobus fumarii 1A]|uniref:Sec-independent protein translocase protein TatC n=1 Tax=Pyrolobus fumarii (strain DSM 11204 / 1A) TaxID=694429 RepID=G0EH60_PYRF1|nr:twin-arginine translocase subunit TatC [Pyrolobus fumarii]AEM39284.1 Sec-independent periplasmic protein translocase [Pyrolobus fumarii 1A]